jgi:hypothetical protein
MRSTSIQIPSQSFIAFIVLYRLPWEYPKCSSSARLTCSHICFAATPAVMVMRITPDRSEIVVNDARALAEAYRAAK